MITSWMSWRKMTGVCPIPGMGAMARRDRENLPEAAGRITAFIKTA
ncbi:MAG: hypothetical protein ACLR0U_25715 [Enterocloster clostridioformis]